MDNDVLKAQFADKAADNAGFAIAYALLELADAHLSAIESLQEPLRSDHPPQGETLSGIEDALRAIAHSIDMFTLSDVVGGLDSVADAIKDTT